MPSLSNHTGLWLQRDRRKVWLMLLVHISFSRVVIPISFSRGVSMSGTPPFALTLPHPVPSGAELCPLPGQRFQVTMQHSDYPQLQEHLTTLAKKYLVGAHTLREGQRAASTEDSC